MNSEEAFAKMCLDFDFCTSKEIDIADAIWFRAIEWCKSQQEAGNDK
jgi:hypothetical protein